MQKLPTLCWGKYYHIYNRGINRENIFFEARNYRFFMDLYGKYIEPLADTYAYCLLRNHFHLLARIKARDELADAARDGDPTRAFSNLFNAYAKAINKAYDRTGGLFQGRFGRVEVTSSRYFTRLVSYIHLNPQKHGFVEDFREYPYSSYNALVGGKRTRVKRQEVLAWFGNQDSLIAFHQREQDARIIQSLIPDDPIDFS